MSRRYADRTPVPADRTVTEIKTLLTRAGADAIGTYDETTQAMIAFRLNSRGYRFTLPFPSVEELRKELGRGAMKHRTPEGWKALRERVIRSRWRALLLALKAKIEAARAGIIALDVALLPFALLPDGKTVSDEVLPRLESMRESGKSVPLLPASVQ